MRWPDTSQKSLRLLVWCICYEKKNNQCSFVTVHLVVRKIWSLWDCVVTQFSICQSCLAIYSAMNTHCLQFLEIFLKFLACFYGQVVTGATGLLAIFPVSLT